jgi:ribosome maturation factor RimP
VNGLCSVGERSGSRNWAEEVDEASAFSFLGQAVVYRDIPEELRRLIEPVVEDHGCELLDVENATAASRAGVLRITIDRKEGDGRVAVERCAEISREIGTQLDVYDAIRGPYQLEVSSPGLDRMLSREKDFAAARGQEVQLKTRRPVEGRRKFRGKLLDFRGGVAVLSVDGAEYEIPFEEIEKANRLYQFTRADFEAKRNAGREPSGESGERNR